MLAITAVVALVQGIPGAGLGLMGSTKGRGG